MHDGSIRSFRWKKRSGRSDIDTRRKIQLLCTSQQLNIDMGAYSR